MKSAPKPGYEGAVQMAVDYALFINLARLSVHKDASAQTRAITTAKLAQLKTWLATRPAATTDESWKAYYAYLSQQIGSLQEEPEEFKAENLLPAPPGAPIGDFDYDFCHN